MPENSVIRRFRAWLHPSSSRRINLSRRRLMMTGLAGVASGLLTKAGSLPNPNGYRQQLLRPPGATPEERFLEECLRCGLCVWNCPTGVIQPAFLEAGSEGIFTPVMKMEIGFCGYCASCSHCPAGILTMRRRHDRHKNRIGLAVIQRASCRSYTGGKTCTVCRDACRDEKAITLRQAPGANAGATLEPFVDQALCVGCGRCEHLCPARPGRAIRVQSAGESRHPANRPATQA